MLQPLVSIAIATYNGEQFLEEQLRSIFRQTYLNIEVCVADDCSTDKTLSILKSYSYKPNFTYVVNESRVGFVKNFECAISLCKGTYIALSDQDDVWENNKIEYLLEHIGSNLLIHSDASLISPSGKQLYPTWKGLEGYRVDKTSLLFSNVVTGCTTLFHKTLLSIATPFPEQLSYHDWWLAICAAQNSSIVYVNRSLTRYRQHEMQHTGTTIDNKLYVTAFIKILIQKWFRKSNERSKVAKKQLENLHALESSTLISMDDTTILNDVISYHTNYINSRFHLKTLLIGLKYRKLIYSKKNPQRLIQMFIDLLG